MARLFSRAAFLAAFSAAFRSSSSLYKSRRAAAAEPFTTLDGVERELEADDLVITDGQKPVALAGVMGGANSEIGDSSTRVLLECAYFTPRGIRRAARRHGLHTESSHRFERGTDPHAVPTVLAHAASLLTRLCGGKAVPGTILAGVAPAAPKRIGLRGGRMRGLLGVAITTDEAHVVLERLGCQVARSEKDPETLDVLAPTFRPDLNREEDLIEEVMRIHGIDEVPALLRPVAVKAGRTRPTLLDRVRAAAVELGLNEAVPYSFLSPAELETIDAPAPVVRLLNPLTEERSVLRTALLPGVLEAMGRAVRHGVREARLFAVGSAFLKPRADGEAGLPEERPQFAAVLVGTRRDGIAKPEPIDVYDAKGVACELLTRVTGHDVAVRPGEASHLHPRARGELLIGDTVVGSFGQLHPDVVDRLDVDVGVFAIELDLAAVARVGEKRRRFQPIPVLPAVTRDLALVVRDEVSAGELARAIREEAGALCESVELFDLFRGEAIGEDRRSLAYHLVFRDPKAATDPDNARTLTDDEVDAVSKSVQTALEKRFGAVVRA